MPKYQIRSKHRKFLPQHMMSHPKDSNHLIYLWEDIKSHEEISRQFYEWDKNSPQHSSHFRVISFSAIDLSLHKETYSVTYPCQCWQYILYCSKIVNLTFDRWGDMFIPSSPKGRKYRRAEPIPSEISGLKLGKSWQKQNSQFLHYNLFKYDKF
jgi:hypothetical protein